jgi:uncharacterized protein
MMNRLLSKNKKTTFLISLYLYLFPIIGQTNGLLWKVSGNGLRAPSFIFGTIHYHCLPESINKPAVSKAVKSSDIVLFELDLGNMEVLMERYQQSLIPQGTSLKSILTSSDYNVIDSVCRCFLGDSLISFDNESPMDLMSHIFLSDSFTGCKGMATEMTILQMARSNNKAIDGLETFEFQDSLLKSIPLETQTG